MLTQARTLHVTKQTEVGGMELIIPALHQMTGVKGSTP